jgi:hypothetical protein
MENLLEWLGGAPGPINVEIVDYHEGEHLCQFLQFTLENIWLKS